MNRIEILTEDGDPPQWIDNLERFVLDVLNELNIKNAELSILFCSRDKIRELNKKYRGKDYPTDVLSFSQIGDLEGNVLQTPEEMENGWGSIVLGDIVIALEIVSENAKEFSVNYEEEIRRVVTHGILHLIGMEHADNSKENEMIKLQEEILKKFTEEKLF